MSKTVSYEKRITRASFPAARESIEGADFRIIETHISVVVLTGQLAFKIKKPVKFDFVDYSTLEQRKQFCEEELRLNRRFSPDIYLGVVPIYEETESGKWEFGIGSLSPPEKSQPSKEPSDSQASGLIQNPDEERAPVEYSVVMKEFAQSEIVAEILKTAGQDSDTSSAESLTPSTIAQFAKHLQDVHSTADQAAGTEPWCQPNIVQTDAENNFVSLEKLFSADRRRSDISEIKKWNTYFLIKISTNLEDRLSTGQVRCCHGDLHLKNLIFRQGQLMAFDGIEFNPEFQWIDLLSELAFPAMDFMARGRPDLGWLLIDEYLTHSGDYFDVALLRFYLVYRALVRAKVTALNPANGLDPSDDSNSNRSGPWDKYLETAAYLATGIRPALTITHGLSGSGKSTAAQKQISSSGGIRIRSDVERRRMTTRDSQQERYSRETTESVYDRLLGQAKAVLDAGFPVVIDATFLERGQRQPFQELANRLDAPFGILHCQAPIESLKERIKKRTDDPSEATVEVLQQQIQSREDLTEEEMRHVLRTNDHE